MIEESKTTTTTTTTTIKSTIIDPVRFSVFNDGDYKATIKLNYIIDNLQEDQTVPELIISRQEQDLFLPQSATHIRIRVAVDGADYGDNIIDEQIHDLKNVTEKCYLLAGSTGIPMYGLCPMPFWQYFMKWTGNR